MQIPAGITCGYGKDYFFLITRKYTAAPIPAAAATQTAMITTVLPFSFSLPEGAGCVGFAGVVGSPEAVGTVVVSGAETEGSVAASLPAGAVVGAGPVGVVVDTGSVGFVVGAGSVGFVVGAGSVGVVVGVGSVGFVVGAGSVGFVVGAGSVGFVVGAGSVGAGGFVPSFSLPRMVT